jgi:Armadillo/beta-catenin-like repeat
MFNLSMTVDNVATIEWARGIPPLVALLGSPSAGAQENAACALWGLSEKVELRVAIASAGGVALFTALLGSPPPNVRMVAAGALNNLGLSVQIVCGQESTLLLARRTHTRLSGNECAASCAGWCCVCVCLCCAFRLRVPMLTSEAADRARQAVWDMLNGRRIKNE